MVPTKQDIEDKLRKMAGLLDGTIARASMLLDTVAGDPGKFEEQVRHLGKQSVTLFKKQKVELEIRILKLRLQEIEKRIEIKLGENGEDVTRP